MIVLDNSIIFTALPSIEAAMSFSATGLSWVQNAYTLAFGGLLLLGARAGDLLGRRRVFIAGLAAFALASFLIMLYRGGGRSPPAPCRASAPPTPSARPCSPSFTGADEPARAAAMQLLAGTGARPGAAAWPTRPAGRASWTSPGGPP